MRGILLRLYMAPLPALVGAGVVHWLVLAAPPMVSQASTGGLASVARYRCGVFGDVAKLRT